MCLPLQDGQTPELCSTHGSDASPGGARTHCRSTPVISGVYVALEPIDPQTNGPQLFYGLR
jgi:hypothetical protein